MYGTYTCVRLRYTFSDHLLVTLLMTSISTVFTLITGRVEQEFAAECAHNDLIELALHKFVAVHLVHLVLALADSTLTTETTRCIERALANILLD